MTAKHGAYKPQRHGPLSLNNWANSDSGPVLARFWVFAMQRGAKMSKVSFDAEPSPLSVDIGHAALVIIDMQRDFLEPGGFGEALGNDVSRLQAAVAPLQEVLAAARRVGMLVIHTREGHRPDLSDAPPHKVIRGDPATRIGAPGPMGRILVRGEAGHDIIPELYPLSDEPVIDKPGKGAFYQTDLEIMLHNRGIDTLFVCGVTTEVCVNTTVREANDRGFRCIVLADCCGSYFPEFHAAGLAAVEIAGCQRSHRRLNTVLAAKAKGRAPRAGGGACCFFNKSLTDIWSSGGFCPPRRRIPTPTRCYQNVIPQPIHHLHQPVPSRRPPVTNWHGACEVVDATDDDCA
jgi:biuret amidohydrolase